jgi:tetratricopeptide (TPR) repeat protein
MSPARARWASLALGALAVLVHLAALGLPFVYDDGRTVTHNPSLRADLGYALVYERFRPLTNLSYYADAQLWGLGEAWGFHLTGVLLHGLIVVLLFHVVYEPSRSQAGAAKAAALAAGILAVHPLFVQSVGYVSGRSGLLVAVWLLLGLLAYRRGVRTGQARWAAPVIACWVLASACKETGALLPALLLAHDGFLARDDGRVWRLRRLHLPALGLLILGGTLRLAIYVGQERGGAQSAEVVLTQLGVTWRYLRLFLAPLGQAVVHLIPQVSLADPGLWLRLLALGAIPAAAWRLRVRSPWAAFGLAWYLIMLAPTTLVPLDEHLAEQRAYLPGIGLSIALAWACVSLGGYLHARDPRVLGPLTAALLIGLGGLVGLTQLRYRVWSEPRALWTEAILRAGPAAHEDPRLRHSPIHAVPYNNLGAVLLREGELDGAERALDRALAMRPDYAEALSNRGAVRYGLSNLAGAGRDYDRSLELVPNNAVALTNRALLRIRLRQDDEALADLDAALTLSPELTMARATRGSALLAQRRYDAAYHDFDLLTQIDPEQVAGWVGAARAATALDRHDDAVAALKRAMSLVEPGSAAHAKLRGRLARSEALRDAR